MAREWGQIHGHRARQGLFESIKAHHHVQGEILTLGPGHQIPIAPSLDQDLTTPTTGAPGRRHRRRQVPGSKATGKWRGHGAGVGRTTNPSSRDWIITRPSASTPACPPTLR